MSETKKDLSEDAQGILAKMEGLFTKFMGKKDPQALKVTSADGTEIDFYELKEGDDISVEAKAKIDGKSASGDHVMPEGQTYRFEKGKLVEIQEADEDENIQALQDQIRKLEAKMAEKETENKGLKAELEKVNKSVTEIQGEFTNLKKAIGSAHDPDEKRLGQSSSDGDPKPDAKRRLFKEPEAA